MSKDWEIGSGFVKEPKITKIVGKNKDGYGDAEKSNKNRRAEKRRVVSELNKGYRGGGVAKKGKGVAL